jgi:surface polysaccharide O-acyltransferase-like enzyme
MPLLFVIAGAGLWLAAQRRSTPELWRERTLRLLVPAIAGMFLIVPPQVFIERVASGQWSGGYLDFYTQRTLRLEPYPAGDFSWHHLWFIVYLYVYVVMLMPFISSWRPARSLRPGAWLYLLALPLGINEALFKARFPESHNLVSDWYTFNHYLLLTLYGVAIASIRGAWDWFAAWRLRSLVAALILLVSVIPLFEYGIVAHDSGVDALFANVFTWVWLTVFLGYGRQYLSHTNRWLAWARDASYPIYILHQTVILAVAFFIIQKPWTPGSKYWLVLVSTLVVCVALYHYVLRRVGILRVLFGIKPERAGAAP